MFDWVERRLAFELLCNGLCGPRTKRLWTPGLIKHSITPKCKQVCLIIPCQYFLRQTPWVMHCNACYVLHVANFTHVSMGVGRIFSRSAIMDFIRDSQRIFFMGRNNGEISFYALKTKRTTIFAKNEIGKYKILKCVGVEVFPSDTHACQLIYFLSRHLYFQTGFCFSVIDQIFLK